MRQRIVWLVWTLTLCVVAQFAAVVPAYAATAIEVTPLKDDAYSEIQKALNLAKKKPENGPYTVAVTPGKYMIGHSLKLYSNTTLKLEGVSLSLSPLTRSNMIRLGDGDDKQQGYYYQNITVIGGDLDHTGHSNTTIKLAHGKNITIKNVTMHNTRDGHLMEVAGVKGLTVDGCVFRDQVQVSRSQDIAEALQIDILNQKHMPSYRSEDLPMKDITIKNCQFENVPRGIGAHTAVLNRYVKNVVIKNNRFKNLRSDAIRIMNFYNCRIEDNRIENAPRGIVAYMGHTKGMYLASSLAKEGQVPSTTATAYQAPPKNQKISIRRNKMTISGSHIYSDGTVEGIFVCGYSFSSALKKGSERDAIPKGNYYMSGVAVSDNIIKTTGHGIRFDNARYSTVRGNKISYTGSKSGGTSRFGIYVLSNSNLDYIKANTISNMKNHGILVTSKSKVKTITSNTIKSPRKCGISVQNATVTNITKNNVSKSGSSAMSMLLNARVDTISKNKISSSKGAGITLESKARVKKITGNTIASAKKYGVVIADVNGPVSITKNKISKCSKYAVLVDKKAKKQRVIVKGNKLSGRRSVSLVRIEGGKVSVSGSRTSVKEAKRP